MFWEPDSLSTVLKCVMNPRQGFFILLSSGIQRLSEAADGGLP